MNDTVALRIRQEQEELRRLDDVVYQRCQEDAMHDEQQIKTMLDDLAEMQAQRQVLELDKTTAVATVLALTPEMKAQIMDIETEFTGKAEALIANIADLETAVKVQVLSLGTTVKGAHLQACWTKPRVSWDTKALDGYAAAHPEIEKFRKVAEPSVSIRIVSNG